MDSPESWRWVWLAAAVLFGIGEMSTPGSFFLLPFALGAVVAAVLAFSDVAIVAQWGAFVAISFGSLVALRPLARRLDIGGPSEGIGSRRLIGREGVMLRGIDAPGELGLVRIDREEWRAESTDGSLIPEGAVVRVADVQGTRVVVNTKELLP
jgi:membrane protein implicated in regulation of membrane protease activity